MKATIVSTAALILMSLTGLACAQDSDATTAPTPTDGRLQHLMMRFHKADVNGDTVYRVRASGLDKASANALCAKVHAAGGACFLAR